jgi:hypothetical protein
LAFLSAGFEIAAALPAKWNLTSSESTVIFFLGCGRFEITERNFGSFWVVLLPVIRSLARPRHAALFKLRTQSFAALGLQLPQPTLLSQSATVAGIIIQAIAAAACNVCSIVCLIHPTKAARTVPSSQLLLCSFV